MSAAKRATFGEAVANWGEILQTQNLADGRSMDLISRWLLIVRASVFPMTITSGAIGGLLAAGSPAANWWHLALAIFGLLVAHAANNMINDYFDLDAGVDTEGYVRTVYAPHPIVSGLISKRGLVAAIAICNLVDLAILAYFTSVRGPLTVAFALAGLFISVFYVAPPIQLKHRGMGEPGVALVWGPLMIGGTYFVVTGEITAWVFAASIPYALLVTAVLFGKHVDKLPSDEKKGIRTLPVILGHESSLFWTCMLMIGFYPAVAVLVLWGEFGYGTLMVLLAIPCLRETLTAYREPKPDEPPEGYPIWPLWYVAWAFRHTRLAGLLLVIGLAVDVILPPVL